MSSLSIASGGHCAGAFAMASCHHTSRPRFISTFSPVRRTTTTCPIDGVSASDASAFCLSGTTAPRRYPPSAVTRTFASASRMRSRSASELKPPNTTPCTAPIRAQASIAIGSSGIIGM